MARCTMTRQLSWQGGAKTIMAEWRGIYVEGRRNIYMAGWRDVYVAGWRDIQVVGWRAMYRFICRSRL